MNDHGILERISLSAPAFWRLRNATPPAMGRWLDAGAMNRVRDSVYCVGLWIALALAAFTCNGLLGLLVHWAALAGAVSVFRETTSGQTGEIYEGEATCAAARIETK